MRSLEINVGNVAEARAANIATQRLALATGRDAVPGICRFCGCTERMPCTVQFDPLTYCAWYDADQTVCSERSCITALYDEESAYRELAKNWERTNEERGALIDRSIRGELDTEGRARLSLLQAYAEFHVFDVAPRPRFPDDLPEEEEAQQL